MESEKAEKNLKCYVPFFIHTPYPNLWRNRFRYPAVLSIMPKIPEISEEVELKDLFQFLPTRIFKNTSGGCPLILVRIF